MKYYALFKRTSAKTPAFAPTTYGSYDKCLADLKKDIVNSYIVEFSSKKAALDGETGKIVYTKD